jgi:hypothetical protein
MDLIPDVYMYSFMNKEIPTQLLELHLQPGNGQ